jgi:hypothetical protein
METRECPQYIDLVRAWQNNLRSLRQLKTLTPFTQIFLHGRNVYALKVYCFVYGFFRHVRAARAFY